MKKWIIISILMLIMCVIVVGIRYYANQVLPVALVEEYLTARYNMNYHNVEQKTKIQAGTFDKSLLNHYTENDFFNNDINYFNQKKLHTTLKNIEIYNIKKKNDIISLHSRVSVLFKSDLPENEDWSQTTNADIRFVLKKETGHKYFISYIDIENKEYINNSSQSEQQNHEH